MKRYLCTFLAFLLLTCPSLAAPVTLSGAASAGAKPIQYKQNARTIEYAFVFDGPSEKNVVVMGQFQKAITMSTAPDYRASFPKDMIYTGNWTYPSVKIATDKALNSNATMVISLGYLSTKYLNSLQDKKKFVLTIDQYGLRDLGDGFFNPIQQSVKGAMLFKKLLNFNKAAILMNENFYKTKSDWNTFLQPKLAGMDFKVIPVGDNIDKVFADMNGCDAAVITPLFNLSVAKRKELFDRLNSKQIPTYSTLGKEDVQNGVLLGAGAYDLDRKVAEATSFSIKGVLNGQKGKPEKIQFYEDEILYINKDTAELIGYQPHLRLMNSAEVITNKPPVIYNLASVFGMLEKNNLDIERKRLLLKAARKSSLSAMLKYLPTFGVTLGYQDYNKSYAESVRLSIPESTGIFGIGIEQVIYSPALVTNILIKKRNVDFSKAEQFMTEQNMGIDVALLYVETLMLENMIQVQKDYVKESRENLAIARVREKMGYCGTEEALRWASQLNVNEQNLLEMTAELRNLKIAINKLLFKDQTEDYDLAELKATDPAFYTSEINIIDYVSTPQALEQFTQMLVEEAYSVAPELVKLKAAIKMKDYEKNMYIQKFFLPDAKLSLDYQNLMGREFAGPATIGPIPTPLGNLSASMQRPEAQSFKVGVYAQWKPIEGGQKFAEIARVKAEREELQRYEDEVKTQLEQQIRETVNKALAGYFSIEKNYKAMYASGENYHNVKKMYLRGEAPIAQVIDAQKIYLDSKVSAMNSQYVFFKELLWVQRGICATNWTTASPEAKAFIQKVKDNLEKRSDISLL